MASANQTNSRLDEAKKALAGEERYRKLAEQEEDVVRRRREAMKAMEGESHRQRREIKERDERARAAAEAELLKKQQATLEAEQKRLAAEAAARQAEAEARLKNQQARVSKIESAEKTIDSIKQASLNLSPIRTYKSDFARAVSQGGMSAAKIALSQQAKRVSIQEVKAEAERGPSLGSKILVIGLTLVFIGVVAGLGYLVWTKWQNNDEPVAPIGVTPPTPFIFSENNVAVDLSGDSLDTPSATSVIDRTIGTLETQTIGINHLYFVKNNRLLNFFDFRQEVNLNLPDKVARNLTPDFMFGTYHDGRTQNRFLILGVNTYEQVFAGSLGWESQMAEDLRALLHGSQAVNLASGRTFVDRRVQNKDIRLVAGSDGQVFLLYTFLDDDHLLITTNEATFQEIYALFRG